MTKPDISDADWRTSSRSGGTGQCVAVALVGDDVAVRDSKHPDGAVLVFTHDEWTTFLDEIYAGDL